MNKFRLKLTFAIILIMALLLAVPDYSYSVTDSSQNSIDASESTDTLNVYYLDIGQGDCTLITQGSHAMMVDAGDNDQGTRIQSYLNYLDIERFDYLILTHPDADHIGGADVVIYKFDVASILMPDQSADTRTYDDVLQAMKSKNYTAVCPQVGDTYAFGDASFTILSPVRSYSDTNNNSIVIRLTYGKNTFLFTGDAEEQAEADMISGGMDLQADVLKAGHHGSSTSTSNEFLDAVSPSFAVISCGQDNKYGHPHAETLNKFRQRGIAVYRTDEQGTITATSDGRNITWNTGSSDSWLTGEVTASSTEVTNAEPTSDLGDDATYILNTNTCKFHLPDCASVEDIASHNKEISSLTRKDLIKEGFAPCGRCKP
jgi:beta-lactamase superfamily II metal-dependent hydrolase